METFVKRARAVGEDLRLEAAALSWLAEAEPAGGLRVARVRSASKDELVEERIATGAPTREAARRVGEALARTHAAGAPWLGCPPQPTDAFGAALPSAYVISGVPTPLVPHEKAPLSWGAFYAEWRIQPHVRALCDEGFFDADEVALFERLCSRLEDGDFDAPQPALVEEAIAATSGAPASVTCARLHGDLWAGNLLWDADAHAATGGALIDPMAHGGHAETDLAMLALFGAPYLDALLAAYDAVSPLADGWRDRVALHQLAPLLLHCRLFGWGYRSDTLRALGRYVGR